MRAKTSLAARPSSSATRLADERDRGQRLHADARGARGASAPACGGAVRVGALAHARHGGHGDGPAAHDSRFRRLSRGAAVRGLLSGAGKPRRSRPWSARRSAARARVRSTRASGAWTTAPGRRPAPSVSEGRYASVVQPRHRLRRQARAAAISSWARSCARCARREGGDPDPGQRQRRPQPAPHLLRRGRRARALGAGVRRLGQGAPGEARLRGAERGSCSARRRPAALSGSDARPLRPAAARPRRLRRARTRCASSTRESRTDRSRCVFGQLRRSWAHDAMAARGSKMD